MTKYEIETAGIFVKPSKEGVTLIIPSLFLNASKGADLSFETAIELSSYLKEASKLGLTTPNTRTFEATEPTDTKVVVTDLGITVLIDIFKGSEQPKQSTQLSIDIRQASELSKLIKDCTEDVQSDLVAYEGVDGSGNFVLSLSNVEYPISYEEMKDVNRLMLFIFGMKELLPEDMVTRVTDIHGRSLEMIYSSIGNRMIIRANGVVHHVVKIELFAGLVDNYMDNRGRTGETPSPKLTLDSNIISVRDSENGNIYQSTVGEINGIEIDTKTNLNHSDIIRLRNYVNAVFREPNKKVSLLLDADTSMRLSYDSGTLLIERLNPSIKMHVGKHKVSVNNSSIISINYYYNGPALTDLVNKLKGGD